MDNYRFIDLFSGLGGFHIALKNENKNNECVFACDVDAKCREVYELNFNIEPFPDITELDIKTIPDFNVLCGGFPCQAFSNAGKKNAFNDKRGLLFDYIIKIISEKKPLICLLENVKHIKKVSNGKVYEYIYEQMYNSGYEMMDVLLSPYDINIPQNRERYIFIAFRSDVVKGIKNWKNSMKELIKLNIQKYREKNTNYRLFLDKTDIDPKYFLDKKIIKVLDAWDKLIKSLGEGTNISFPITIRYFNSETSEDNKKWENEYIKKNNNFYKEHKEIIDKWLEENMSFLTEKEIYRKLEWQVGKIKKNDSIYNYYIQFRQSGIRVKKTDYFPTLVAISQIPVYTKEKRYITPLECARLQSFPDSYKFLDNDKYTYKQIGNSVNIQIIQLVWECITSFIKQQDMFFI